MISKSLEKFQRKGFFLGDTSGSVGIIFGLSFIPAVMVMGVAIDYRNATVTRTRLQTAVDTASLVVAQSLPDLTQSARQQLAVNTVNAKLGPLADRYSVTVTETEPSTGRYVVTAAASIPTTVMKFAHFDNIAISATSTATAATVNAGGGGCVLSLNESAVNAVWYNGHAEVRLTNCNIYGNSGSSQALDVSGNAELWSHLISVHGNVKGQNKIHGAQAILEGQPRTDDPYLTVPTPAYSGCNFNNYQTSTNATLNPGVYCNGFAINSDAEVTLNPGLYVIDRGAFKINGQARLTGSGVTIVFTSSTGDNWPTAIINGGARVDLVAPDATAAAGLPGILMYGDRAMPAGTDYRLNGGSTQNLKGAIYLPEADLRYAGGDASDGKCVHLIADTLTFIGNSNIAIDGCGGMGVRPFGATRTVRVAS